VSEQDLCAAGVRFLEARGYAVGEECKDDARRMDIVGLKGQSLWIIEAKLDLGRAVICQALAHLGKAQRISVLIPASQATAATLWAPILNELPIGVLVHGPTGVLERVSTSPRPPSPHLDYRSEWKPGRAGGRPAGSQGAPKTNALVKKLEKIARNWPGSTLANHFEEHEVRGALHAAKKWTGDWERRGNTRTNLRLYPKGHFDA